MPFSLLTLPTSGLVSELLLRSQAPTERGAGAPSAADRVLWSSHTSVRVACLPPANYMSLTDRFGWETGEDLLL